MATPALKAEASLYRSVWRYSTIVRPGQDAARLVDPVPSFTLPTSRASGILQRCERTGELTLQHTVLLGETYREVLPIEPLRIENPTR
jgi:hypothetical protein